MKENDIELAFVFFFFSIMEDTVLDNLMPDLQRSEPGSATLQIRINRVSILLIASTMLNCWHAQK